MLGRVASKAELHARQLIVEGSFELLSRYPWSAFATLTFRRGEYPPGEPERLVHVWCCRLGRQLYGHRWYRRDDFYFAYVLEQREFNPHVHLVLSVAEHTKLDELERCGRQLWMAVGGFAAIDPVRSAKAVSRYLTKEVFRGAEINYGRLPAK